MAEEKKTHHGKQDQNSSAVESEGVADVCIKSEMSPLSLVKKKKKKLSKAIAPDKNRVKNRCRSPVVSMTMC